MKYLPLLALLFLCSCSTNNSPSSYGCVGTGPGCNPMVPHQPNVFVNAAVNSNYNVTSMLSRNESQVSAYITNRLIGLELENASPQNNLEIAQLALWLTTASEEDIETALQTNEDNIHRAMYVLTSGLNSCFDENASIGVAECFTNWRETPNFARALASLQTNANILSIDNADFTSTQMNDGATLKFGINNSGKITTLSVIKDNGSDETVFTRNDNTNTFNGSISVNEEAHDAVLTYKSAGKTLGLTYSDFGTYDIDSDLSAITHHDVPFAGGYTEKRIAEADISDDINLSGQAVGTVTSYKNGSNNPESINLENGRAFLTFNKTSGDTDIVSTFDNWYTVTVHKGDTETIKFGSYHENTEGYDMHMISPSGPFSDPIVAHTTDLNYYGANPENGIPTEATGITQFRDCGVGVVCDGNYDTTPEIKLDMAFGVYDK